MRLAVWIGRSHCAGRGLPKAKDSATHSCSLHIYQCAHAPVVLKALEVCRGIIWADKEQRVITFHLLCWCSRGSSFLGGNEGAEANMTANINSLPNLEFLKPKCLQLKSPGRLEKSYWADGSKIGSPATVPNEALTTATHHLRGPSKLKYGL